MTSGKIISCHFVMRLLKNEAVFENFVGRCVRTVIKPIASGNAVYFEGDEVQRVRHGTIVGNNSHSQIVNFAAKIFNVVHSSTYNLTENVHIVGVVRGFSTRILGVREKGHLGEGGDTFIHALNSIRQQTLLFTCFI